MLACRVSGKGPAVVLLHGFPLDRSIWDGQISHLSARYRVVAPDLPGLGETPAFEPGDPVTMERMAGAVLETLNVLGIDRAAFAGHSMGGYITLALTKLAPERVTGIAMVASQAGADTPEAKASRFVTAEKVMQQGAAVIAEGMGRKLFAPSVPETNAAYRAVQAVIRRASTRGIRDCLLAMAEREEMRPHLAAIRVPTVVIHGEQDQLVPADRADVTAGGIPRAVLVRLTAAGHMPMLEEPAAVNNALDRWLERVYA